MTSAPCLNCGRGGRFAISDTEQIGAETVSLPLGDRVAERTLANKHGCTRARVACRSARFIRGMRVTHCNYRKGDDRGAPRRQGTPCLKRIFHAEDRCLMSRSRAFTTRAPRDRFGLRSA